MLNQRAFSTRSSHPSTRQTSLNYQTLESRQLLAGDVQVSVTGGTLNVVGDSAANEINIVGTDAGINVAGVDTSINGTTTPFLTTEAIRNVIIRLNDGADKATIRRLTLSNDFQIFGGDGNDELRLFHIFPRDFIGHLGGGDDVLELEDIRTQKDFSVFMEAGDDIVGSLHVIASRNAQVFGASGNDTFAADDLYVKKKFQLDLGDGDDQGLFAGVTDIYKTSRFQMGAGNDYLALVPAESNESSHLRGKARIDAGSGNDSVVADSNLNLRRRSTVSGGGGTDAMQFLGTRAAELSATAQVNGFASDSVGDVTATLNSAYDLLSANGLDPYRRGNTQPQSSLLELDPATQFVSVNDPTPTASVRWDKAIQSAVVTNKTGPTIASRAYAMMHTAMYDAWSAYDRTAVSTVRADDLQRPNAENTNANKVAAMSFAAFKVCQDLFPAQASTFSALMTSLGLNPNNKTTDTTMAAGIGNTMADALLISRHADGSNQLGDSPTGTSGVAYSDPTGYAPVNQIGATTSIENWTPEFVPIDATASETRREQHFLTPQWGAVTSFALTAVDAVRPTAPQPFLLVDGTVDLAARTITLDDDLVVNISSEIVGTIINPAFVAQAERVVNQSASLTDRQKLIAEFWEDGGGTSFPPGTWMTFGEFISARDNHTIDQDAKMFFGLSNAVFDAGVATWESKTFYDYTRPIRAIRELGKLGLIGELDAALGGQAITARTPDGSLGKILATEFMTYQTPHTDSSPPFAEYTSGHSAFSAAGAEILRRFTGSDTFNASVNFGVGQSRFEPNITPASPVTLAWDTFTVAAEEAGVSRIYGGIHFDDGDLNGRILGKSVGELVWNRANFFINGGQI